jgi:diguanylate cyclase (GGDEF)-like protein/PAS domain S-box-containing protein
MFPFAAAQRPLQCNVLDSGHLEKGRMSKSLPVQSGDSSRFPRVYHFHADHGDVPSPEELGRQMAFALEHIGRALCIFDAKGRITAHNRFLPHMLGLGDAKLRGRSLLDLNRLAAEAAGVSTISAEITAKHALARQIALVRSKKGGETEHVFPSGKVLRAEHRPMGDGAWVMTIEDITERKRAEATAAHLSRHDALTGLPNRAHFLEALTIAINQLGPLRRIALVSFDLDQFSDVNDTYGTALGDAVLTGVANRFRAECRVGESIARMGGDEFAVFKVMDSEEELEEFVPRLIRGIAAPVTVGGAKVSISARMGIAILPNDATDGNRLIANAELALARARSEPDGTVCMYDPQYDEVARRRRELAREMADGLEQGQFFVVYQPQFSTRTGENVGYEALLRWHHPIRGLVSPTEFIPIAEQSGLIDELTRFVLETACRDVIGAGWAGRVAVNLSPIQLGDARLAETVAKVLRSTGLPPGRLELEVTETAIVAGKQVALRTLAALQSIGVSVALDDFGTGYSSLETLRALKWNKIKLDRSFVAEVESSDESRAIMHAMILLGHALRTPVLAEGVETGGQLEFLRRENCDEVQGFLLGRPEAFATRSVR